MGNQDLAQELKLRCNMFRDMSSPAALHVKNAPSPRLVFTYLIGGILSFLFLGGWTAFSYADWGGFYANPRLLAWVHVAVLLWLNMVIFGVLFQFVPVVLNVRLGSEKLAWWQLWFYVPGAIGMAACFWFGRLDWPLHSFASVLWVGFFLFVWNILITYRSVTEWTLTAKFIYAAVLYLLVTILLGLFLSIHLAYPMLEISHLTLLKLHAHFGFAGWLIMLVIGVSLKLLPMFLLSHNYSTKPGAAAFYLVNAGLLTWALAVVFALPATVQAFFAMTLVFGIGCYLVQAALIFSKRNRIKSDPFRRHAVRKMQFPLLFAAGAFGALAVTLVLALTLALLPNVIPGELQNRLILVYGATILLGFFSLLTQSFLYKIIPFLVWLKKFSKTVGRVKIPKIDDLVPRRSAIAQLSTYCLAVSLAIGSLAFDVQQLGSISAGLLFLSAAWLPVNLFIVWRRAVPVGQLTSAPSCEPPIKAPHQADENTTVHRPHHRDSPHRG